MIHYRNRRSFASRTARGFARLQKFSSADKPAPSDLAFAGTTGSAEGSIPGQSALQANADALVGESAEVTNLNGTVDRDLGVTDAPHVAPQQCGETAGAFIPMLAVGQYHYDRWATLAVIAVFFSVFAVAIIRANRFPKPLRRGGRDAEKPKEPQGMALAHESEASRINRGLTPDGHRAVKQPAGRVMPQQQFSSRPTTPPRGPFAGRGDHRAND